MWQASISTLLRLRVSVFRCQELIFPFLKPASGSRHCSFWCVHLFHELINAEYSDSGWRSSRTGEKISMTTESLMAYVPISRYQECTNCPPGCSRRPGRQWTVASYRSPDTRSAHEGVCELEFESPLTFLIRPSKYVGRKLRFFVWYLLYWIGNLPCYFYWTWALSLHLPNFLFASSSRAYHPER